MIPEVIWNTFDRPNPPLEKRSSLSPKSAKILEVSQPSTSKRPHEEEEEEDNDKDSRVRKDSRERDREREREKESDAGQDSKRGSKKVASKDHGDHDDDDDSQGFPDGTVDAVVRLRGLPWSIKEDDIRQFMKDLTIPPAGVYFEIDSNGKRSGEGYVRFMSVEDSETALKYDHKASFFFSFLVHGFWDNTNRKLPLLQSAAHREPLRGGVCFQFARDARVQEEETAQHTPAENRGLHCEDEGPAIFGDGKRHLPVFQGDQVSQGVGYNCCGGRWETHRGGLCGISIRC